MCMHADCACNNVDAHQHRDSFAYALTNTGGARPMLNIQNCVGCQCADCIPSVTNTTATLHVMLLTLAMHDLTPMVQVGGP